jgi:hypothetical protein
LMMGRLSSLFGCPLNLGCAFRVHLSHIRDTGKGPADMVRYHDVAKN